jgi:hypothetical protein
MCVLALMQAPLPHASAPSPTSPPAAPPPAGYDTDNYDPNTPQQCDFVNSFQTGMLQLISALPPDTGIWSPTCFVHCLSGQNTWRARTLMRDP